MADKIIDCLPQASFNNNSLLNIKPEEEQSSQVYLCWNMIGTINIRNEESLKLIDINFSEMTNKKKLVILNKNNYSLATMNNCGALLANQIEEENIDEYENEDKPKNATMEFKTIYNWSKYKDWQITFPKNEVIKFSLI